MYHNSQLLRLPDCRWSCCPARRPKCTATLHRPDRGRWVKLQSSLEQGEPLGRRPGRWTMEIPNSPQVVSPRPRNIEPQRHHHSQRPAILGLGRRCPWQSASEARSLAERGKRVAETSPSRRGQKGTDPYPRPRLWQAAFKPGPSMEGGGVGGEWVDMVL